MCLVPQACLFLHLLTRLYILLSWDAGNPRVTPEVTRDVCLLARMMAANLYYSQIEELMFEVPDSILKLSMMSFICSIKLLVLLYRCKYLDNVISYPDSCLCGAAMMNFVFVRMYFTVPQGEMQSTT